MFNPRRLPSITALAVLGAALIGSTFPFVSAAAVPSAASLVVIGTSGTLNDTIHVHAHLPSTSVSPGLSPHDGLQNLEKRTDPPTAIAGGSGGGGGGGDKKSHRPAPYTWCRTCLNQIRRKDGKCTRCSLPEGSTMTTFDINSPQNTRQQISQASTSAGPSTSTQPPRTGQSRRGAIGDSIPAGPSYYAPPAQPPSFQMGAGPVGGGGLYAQPPSFQPGAGPIGEVPGGLYNTNIGGPARPPPSAPIPVPAPQNANPAPNPWSTTPPGHYGGPGAPSPSGNSKDMFEQ